VRVEEEQDRQAQLQRQTFARYATDWLAHRELAASTRHNYSQLLKHHLLPTFAQIPLTQTARRGAVGHALSPSWPALDEAKLDVLDAHPGRGAVAA